MNKKKSFLVSLLIGIIGIILGAYFMTKKVEQSESYKIAYKFIETNPQIHLEVGAVRSIDYYPFGHRMVDRGSSGYAEYRFDIETTESSSEVKVFIELSKRLGEWMVENAVLEIVRPDEKVERIRLQ